MGFSIIHEVLAGGKLRVSQKYEEQQEQEREEKKKNKNKIAKTRRR